jgi:hypothetical protein
MDYEYLDRLKKSLEELFDAKSTAWFNTKDYGDIRELQGYMKAIKKFGDLISEASNPPRKEEVK